MQAERQLNYESVTSVTCVLQIFRFKTNGGSYAEVEFLHTIATSEAGRHAALSPGFFLFVPFEQDHLLVWERNLDFRFVQSFFDKLWDAETHVKPVLAFDKRTSREINRTIVQG